MSRKGNGTDYAEELVPEACFVGNMALVGRTMGGRNKHPRGSGKTGWSANPMHANHCIVRDNQGRELAGPFGTEQAARMWIVFNYYRYRLPFTIACVESESEPLVRYDSLAEVPQAVWERQTSGELIVVRTAEGKAAVFS